MSAYKKIFASGFKNAFHLLTGNILSQIIRILNPQTHQKSTSTNWAQTRSTVPHQHPKPTREAQAPQTHPTPPKSPSFKHPKMNHLKENPVLIWHPKSLKVDRTQTRSTGSLHHPQPTREAQAPQTRPTPPKSPWFRHVSVTLHQHIKSPKTLKILVKASAKEIIPNASKPR